MKKTLFIISLIVLMSIAICAQKDSSDGSSAEGDISGTWNLDEKKSIFPYRGERESYRDYALTISKNGSEIKITKIFMLKGQESKSTITLFADKRGEQNTESHLRVRGDDDARENYFWLEDVNIKSETFWKNGKLIRNGTFGIEVGILKPKRDLRHVIKEVFELSADGKTLVVDFDLKILDSPTNIVSRSKKFIFKKAVD
jgi:hypothetical protein